jgi:hypothetical protein
MDTSEGVPSFDAEQRLRQGSEVNEPQQTAGPDSRELQWTGISIPGPTTVPTDGSAEDLLGPP